LEKKPKKASTNPFSQCLGRGKRGKGDVEKTSVTELTRGPPYVGPAQQTKHKKGYVGLVKKKKPKK